MVKYDYLSSDFNKFLELHKRPLQETIKRREYNRVRLSTGRGRRRDQYEIDYPELLDLLWSSASREGERRGDR